MLPLMPVPLRPAAAAEADRTPSIPRRRRAWRRIAGIVGACVAIGLAAASGCSRGPESVVVYAAQDRVFAEPLFQEFTRSSGMEVRAVYDNEATKTTGLANRLRAEAPRPQADVWWSNEEMRTRQLVRQGVLMADWIAFGRRERVWVVSTERADALPADLSLASLTNAAYRGRLVLAYPVFGSTLTHFLVLRQRWGDEGWRAWCRALVANRPLIVDGNSMVVRLVARGDGWIGLTDSDDVAYGQREGLPVVARRLAPGEGLTIPNTVALVAGSRQGTAARRLATFLQGPEARRQLERVGALDAPGPDSAGGKGEEGGLEAAAWERLLDELDPSVRWLEEVFIR